MRTDGIRTRTSIGAHGDEPIHARGRIEDNFGGRWGQAEFDDNAFCLTDFRSPARLVETLLIAAAGVAEQLGESDADAHVHSARAYAARVGRALDAQAEDRVLGSIADAVSEGVES